MPKNHDLFTISKLHKDRKILFILTKVNKYAMADKCFFAECWLCPEHSVVVCFCYIILMYN